MMRLGQSGRGEDEIRERQRAGKEHRHPQTRMPHDSAERRPQHEAESERRTDESHSLGAMLVIGGVGDVGLRGRNRCGACAVHRARREQPEKCSGKSVNQVADRRAEQSQQKDRTASDAIGNSAEDRRKHELRQRIDRKQQPHSDRADAHLMREHRQERDDDAEAEQVDEDGQKKYQARGRGRLGAGGRLLDWFDTWH